MKQIISFIKQKHLSKSKFMWSIMKTLICFAFVLPMTLSSCKDENDPVNDDSDSIVVVGKDSTSNYAVLSEGNTNMMTAGVISIGHTDAPKGFSIVNLVDNNINSIFTTPYKEFYILWNGVENKVANCYTLTSATDRSMDPKSWTLSASVDSTNWTILDTKLDETFSADNETKEYEFDNKIEYKYYRLNFKNNNGADSTKLAEWTLNYQDVPFSAEVSATNTNMPTGGIITSQSSDSPDGMDILSIVDANTSTKFSTEHDNFYILWEGSSNQAINYYTITSAATSSTMDPKSWTLSGSLDGNSWTTLDAQKDQLFSGRKVKKGYVFTNSKAYKFYKLQIQSNNGGESTQISEWTLQNIPYDITVIMPYSSGSTYTTATPMGTRFVNAHVTTAADKTWLSTASNEPSLLPSASSLTQLKEFPVLLYPYKTPQPADVNQHAIGDCSAVAVFASFAYQYPDFIMDIIKDNGNKTYTVAMFDPQGNPVDVTVTSKFLADKNGTIGAVTGKSNVATWSTILEKAMMKWQYIYKVNADIGGIGTEHVAPLFTGVGNSYSFGANRLNSVQLRRAVESTLNQGKIVIGGFTQNGVWVSGNHNSVSAHAFTLMYSLDGNALFSMRNPWGGEDDGVYNIPDKTEITSLIDLRIVYPGKAANYSKGIPGPYTPPYLTASQSKMRVSEELLRSGK